MMDNILVTNIQRMCFHDGPGIRTTVFLKGCTLNCPWCSNPENINFAIEEYYKDGIAGTYGKLYTSEELLREIKKDITFYGDKGGVTFSGGEALIQIENLIPLLTKLKDLGVHIAVETALFVPCDYVKKASEFIDYFIVDVKMLDKDSCKSVLGGNLEDYYKNIEFLMSKNKIDIFRVPLCYEYTFTDDNILKIMDFFSLYSGVPVQIFAIHRLGEKKYVSLGKNMPNFKPIDDSDINVLCKRMCEKGIKAEVIRI